MRLFIYENYVINVFDDADAMRVLADDKTVRELDLDEITAVFGAYGHLAGPANTAVDDLGNITFNLPDKYTDLACWLNAVVRPQRDEALRKSDKYMLSDYPITSEQKSAWAAYRQALRDLPDTLTSIVSQVPWPDAPAE